MTNPNDLVPTSSPPRPPAGTTSPNRPRPSSPSPLGDEVDLSRRSHTTTTTPTSSPGTTSESPLFKPGTTWLVTPNTKDAWAAALTLLDDDNWHDIEDLHDAMHATGLADRTIANHLRSAGRRRWITRRNKRVRLLDRAAAVEQALDALR